MVPEKRYQLLVSVFIKPGIDCHDNGDQQFILRKKELLLPGNR